MTNSVDYIVQKGKATKNKTASPPPRSKQETPRFKEKESLCRQLQLDPKGFSILELTAVDDLGLDGRADGAGGRAEGLNLLHDLHGLGVSNIAEDDVLAVEPGGDDGGDEELGAVATAEKDKSAPSPKSTVMEDRSEFRLTCWDPRWPWRAGRGGRACT